jgi:uncharacterized RDD family membrane protein YckC
MPETVTIGSDASCDFPIAFEGVSSQHCRLRFEDGEIWVEDLGSANGTYVDDLRVEPGGQQRLSPSSELSLGESVTLSREDIRDLRPSGSANKSNQRRVEAPPRAASSEYEPSRGHAGFWRRGAAFVIDGLILVVSGPLVGGLIGLLVASGSSRGGPSPVTPAVVNAVVSVIQWLYFALFESSERQATPGKQIIGIKVTDMQGNRIGFWQATGRNFGKIVSGIILFIGYFMAGFTEKNQALHDIMAGCLVINKE